MQAKRYLQYLHALPLQRMGMTVKAYTEDCNVMQMYCSTTHCVDVPHIKIVRQSEGAASQGTQSAQYGEQFLAWNTGYHVLNTSKAW